MAETTKNLSNLCRTCLKQSYKLISLNERLTYDCTLTIADTIKKCLSIQLTNQQECNNICIICVAQVKQTHHFYESCVNSERIFGSFVSLTPIKQEWDDIKIESTPDIKYDEYTIELTYDNNESSVKNEVEEDEPTEMEVEDFQGDPKITSKRLSCNYCNESFTASHLVVDHLYKNHNVCHLCYTRMPSKNQLAEHISGCTFRVKCNVCDETYLYDTHCRKHFMKCRENYLQTLKSRNEPYSAIVSERLKCIDEQHKRFVDVEQSNSVVCLICDTIVPKKSFRLHLRREHEDNNGELTCRLCHRKLPHYIYVKKHMERMHGDVNNVILNGGHFDLVQHFRVTFENKRKLTHKCVDCTETYDLKRDLTRHRRQTHKACARCDKSFKKRAEYMKHRLVCVALECEICHAKSKTHAQANKHFLTCAKTYLNGNVNDGNEKRIREKFESVLKSSQVCAVCEEYVTNNTKKHRQKHLDDAGHFKCAKCDAMSDNYQTLHVHFTSQHQNTQPIQSPRIFTCHLCRTPTKFIKFREFHKHIAHDHVDKNGRITCNECPARYRSYKQIETHLTVKHNVVMDPNCRNGLKRMRGTTKDGCICPHCGVRMRERRNLIIHIRYKHTKERPVVCEICSGAFVSPWALRMHVQLKHTEKYLPCDECEKKFSTAYYLSQHKRGCHDKENRQCHVCSKVCKGASALRHHMETHGERKFKCNYCDKSFYSNRHLRTHTYIHTGEKPIVCRYCPQGFAQYTSRNLHEQRFHKNEFVEEKMEN